MLVCIIQVTVYGLRRYMHRSAPLKRIGGGTDFVGAWRCEANPILEALLAAMGAVDAIRRAPAMLSSRGVGTRTDTCPSPC